VCEIEGVMKYSTQYEGWNSCYDVVHIASKTMDPVPEPEVENDTDSSKSPPEVCIIVVKRFDKKWLV